MQPRRGNQSFGKRTSGFKGCVFGLAMTPAFALGWAIPSMTALVIPLITAMPTQAQTLAPEVRDEFLADPLMDQPRDPLLPSPPIDRPLSPLELYILEQELDQLAAEAEALVQGQPNPSSELESDPLDVDPVNPLADGPVVNSGFRIVIPTSDDAGEIDNPLGDDLAAEDAPFDAGGSEDADFIEAFRINSGFDIDTNSDFTTGSEADREAVISEEFAIEQAFDEARNPNPPEDVEPNPDSDLMEDPDTPEDSEDLEDSEDSEDPEDPEVEESNTDKALALWMREVRLRRVLGLDPELEAIDRVAQWIRDLSSTEELQLLAARLAVIQADLDITNASDRQRLDAMSTTYTTLGKVTAAAELHRALADNALERGQRSEHQAQLEALASLYADWFYFPEAADTYAELVQLAQASANPEAEIRFLNSQIDNLEQAQQFAAALTAQQQLLSLLNANEELWPLVAELQYHMAQNYRQVGNLDLASRQYQIAYTNAISIQQLAVAADALRELSHLYRDLERLPDVDYLYQQLLAVERAALNAYGLMDTFDQIGQLYELTENPEGAILAYREGLLLANQLRHRQEYFESQINRLTTVPEPAS